jgi:hypothetical protein
MKTVAKVSALLLLIVCAAFVGATQDKLRRVEQPAKFVYKNTPVEVVVKLDDKEMSGREAQAGPDWLRRISLEITNTSDKDINWLLINVMLKEPVYGATEPTLETAGIVITLELPFSEPKIRILPAGGRVVLKPPASLVDYWTKFAWQQGMEDIEKVILDIKLVRFTDDTGWERGRLTRKDPESGQYVFVTENPPPPVLHSPASVLVPNRPRLSFLTQDSKRMTWKPTREGACGKRFQLRR